MTVTWAGWVGECGWLLAQHLSIWVGDGKMAGTNGNGKEGENTNTFARTNHWGNWLDLVD